ncbi:MAG: hypothetical protein JWM71_2493 [Solirubrobacteraceae bacterium]|nr:hypothetical protein [Solirubrobacteraceae bacterium]
MKLLYKPFGIVLGVIAGLLGRRLFTVIWGRIDPEHDEPPEAKTKHTTDAKAIGAAALQGAIFSGVRAGVDRAGAKGFYHLTGVWPGEKDPDPEDS